MSPADAIPEREAALPGTGSPDTNSPATGLPVTPETIEVAGFSRLRYLIVLLLVAAVAALWVLLTQGKWNGVGAYIVLPLFALAVWWLAGPPNRLRRIVLGPDGIEITRHTRVRTRIDAGELAGVRREADALVLTPADPAAFLTRHRELRPLRHGDEVSLPLT